VGRVPVPVEGLLTNCARIHLETAKKTDAPIVSRLVDASKSEVLFRMLQLMHPKGDILWKEGLQEARDIESRLIKEVSYPGEGAV
jgi:hypothetical protein